MFSVEHGFDHSTIVVMDDTGDNDDIILTFFDDGLYISQQSDLTIETSQGSLLVENENVITLTNEMLEEIILALKSPEGFYKVTIKK